MGGPSREDLLATIETLTHLTEQARAEVRRIRAALEDAESDNRALRRAVVRLSRNQQNV